MTEFPKGLRIARPGDEDRLFALFMIAHAENGYGDVDHDHVKTVIAKACVGDNCIIALAEGPERIEAAIGLHPARRWYSTTNPKNYYSEDLLIYVHPLHRRSRHAVKLLQFAQWWEQETKIPVVLGLMPKDDFEDKERLFERFGRRVGSLFMIGGAAEWPAHIGTS
jgi:GNAT superfamily N-acetyltransferase